MKTRVFLIGEPAPVRRRLRARLEGAAGIEIVGEASDHGRGGGALKRSRADVVIAAMAAAAPAGSRMIRSIHRRGAPARILAIPLQSDPRYLFDFLRAGAGGILVREDVELELIAAVEALRAEQVYLGRQAAQLAIDDYVRRARRRTGNKELGKLTTREREILQLITDGNSSSEVAHELRISTHTVDTHRRHIMDKLNLRTLAALVKFAIRSGLTSMRPDED